MSNLEKKNEQKNPQQQQPGQFGRKSSESGEASQYGKSSQDYRDTSNRRDVGTSGSMDDDEDEDDAQIRNARKSSDQSSEQLSRK